MRPNSKILSGNELLVQGGLEAGIDLYTGYPGSPLADYFLILNQKKDFFHDLGARVVIANSEANAAAMASGAKQAGKNTLVAMKSMGLHVASDALSVGNFARPGNGAVVIAVGDDPWSMSTSTPADSRYLFKHLHIPFLEPSGPEELKNWVAVALELAKETSLYTGLLLTTSLAEGGGRVALGAPKELDKSPLTLDPRKFDLQKNVMVPPNSLKADQAMIEERFPLVEKVLEKMNLDQEYGSPTAEIGIICNGATFETLKQVLEGLGILEKVGLLKVAASFPLVRSRIEGFCKKRKKLLVVEEKRGFLETEVRQLFPHLEIFGKNFAKGEGFPAYGGLDYEIMHSKIKELFKEWGLEVSSKELVVCQIDHLPRRLPTFCPGCPHRETLSLLKELRQDLAKKGVHLITHGDVGCYSLSFLAPFKEMHNLSAMGQGGALGSGVDLFTTNPSVVLMGDSTFFHSGLTDISHSVQAGHQITYILLDNDNTAMTGHQMTPASGKNVEGGVRPRQSMMAVVQGLGVSDVHEVNPSDRYFYKNLLSEIIGRPGTKVIVSNKECALTFQGRLKKEERKIFAANRPIEEKVFYQINTDACEDCRICVEATGCPGLTRVIDPYGTKVAIDPQICVSDSYCTKLKACPSFEKVSVKNYHPTLYLKNREISIPKFPNPVAKKSFNQLAHGEFWHLVVTGVGGSGVTTINKIIAQAAEEMEGREDLSFKFMDQKGLAQRNGNVTGHMAIGPLDKALGPITPLGAADCLVSPDLLDAATQLKYLASEGMAVIDEDWQYPLELLLDRESDFLQTTPEELRKKLQDRLGNRLVMAPFKRMSFDYFGKNVYSTSMIVGALFQAGVLPFSEASLLSAIERALPKNEVEANKIAFSLGRWIYIDKDQVNSMLLKKSKSVDLETYKKSISETLFVWQRPDRYLNRFDQSINKLTKAFPEISPSTLGRYVHDLMVYDRGILLPTFEAQAIGLKALFSEHADIALRILAKTYFIKDEVFVAHAMISPLRSLSDSFYQHLGTEIKKEFINRPRFSIPFLGEIEFDIHPKVWMLKLMRHARILRWVMARVHREDHRINEKVREKLLRGPTGHSAMEIYRELKLLDNLKGYRQVKYQYAKDNNL